METSPTESESSGDSMSFDSLFNGDAPTLSHSSGVSGLSKRGKSTMSKARDVPLSKPSLEPYSVIGEFSYAPTTQTTVVTTTTTTTTSFPPLVLKAPRRLGDRDPKLYPLASSATPQHLKGFEFDVDGKKTYFRESDDPEQSLCEVSVSSLPCNIRYPGRFLSTWLKFHIS